MREPLVQSAPLLTRINVTPIIDVALVLVIILLITAPMFSVAELDVDLPEARARGLENTGYVSITVAQNGQLAVDDQLLGGPEEITPFLANRLAAANGEEMTVVVRADAGLSHGRVRQVLDAARAGGATHLGIATRQGEVVAQ
ncbi:MAG: biopolymer transporter ExbD [Candidatus Krumholzibacteria bacterium]|nr:biopolymer transporter ExbD [Candidatus Krumholzibacteria bacterium]